MICCGDLRQLPPVIASAVYVGETKNIAIWHKLKYFPLTKVVRQSDKTFSDILTKLENGEKFNEEELTLIESRHIKKLRSDEIDAVRIIHLNIDVASSHTI